jgi:hypothetical protein
MTSEERDIYHYMKAAPRAFFSAREIARRAAGKKTFHESPDWAKTVLPVMVEKGYLETDDRGRFCLKRKGEVEAKGRTWVAPNIAKILKQSGKDFSGNVTVELGEEDMGGF